MTGVLGFGRGNAIDMSLLSSYNYLENATIFNSVNAVDLRYTSVTSPTDKVITLHTAHSLAVGVNVLIIDGWSRGGQTF